MSQQINGYRDWIIALINVDMQLYGRQRNAAKLHPSVYTGTLLANLWGKGGPLNYSKARWPVFIIPCNLRLLTTKLVESYSTVTITRLSLQWLHNCCWCPVPVSVKSSVTLLTCLHRLIQLTLTSNMIWCIGQFKIYWGWGFNPLTFG